MSLRTRLGIDVDADTRGVDSGARRAGNSLRAMGRVGRTAALGVAAALTAAAAAGGALAASAAEDDLAARRLEFQIQKVTDATDKQVNSVERWISKQGLQLGVVDDELRPALSKLVAATHDVGKAQDLASLAMDASAGTGKSLETVTMALVRAQNGSVAGLSRLGVQTKDAEGKTLSLQAVTDKLAKTYSGSAAAAADTAAGRYGRLKVQMGELGEELGAEVLPYATKLAKWLLEAVPHAQRFAGVVGRNVGPVLSRLGGFIREDVIPAASAFYDWFVDRIAPGLRRTVTPVLKGVRGFLDRVSEALKDNKDKFQEAAEFIADEVLPTLGDLSETYLPKLGDALAPVIDALGFMADHLEDVWNWGEKVIDMLDTLSVKVSGLHLDDLSSVLSPLQVLGKITGDDAVPRLTPDAELATGSSWTNVVNINVDGSGIVDENAVAQKIATVVDRHLVRTGKTPVFGGGIAI